MDGNKRLGRAKNKKNDEFYTQYYDVQQEIKAYTEYDMNVFRDKTILLPCDDPYWSSFTNIFADNFETFGLKKLISTSYVKDGRGHLLVLEKEKVYSQLQGDGDFRSEEVTQFRDEADVIITNPPFSIFREFFDWILDAPQRKQFLFIAGKNITHTKKVFSLIKENKMWLGAGDMNGDMLFIAPDDFDFSTRSDSGKKTVDGKTYLRSPSGWFTNIQHKHRRRPFQLQTMAYNKEHNKGIKRSETAYTKYANYDAIEVPLCKAIPSDYDGVMGVPTTFFNKYCEKQFELIEVGRGNDGKPLRFTNGVLPYCRIMIRHRSKQ